MSPLKVLENCPLHCRLTAQSCLARQRAMFSPASALHLGCGPLRPGGQSPCPVGRRVARALVPQMEARP